MHTYDYPLTLQHGPHTLQAFLPTPDVDAIAAHAVAFANTDGGAIVVGLTPQGAYTGPPDGSATARALTEAARLCTPTLPLKRYELVATPGGPALAVRIPRSPKVHALHDGRVLVREGGRNRELSGDEIHALVSARSVGDFDGEVVPGVTLQDLDPELLSTFLIKRTLRHPPPPASTTTATPLPLVELGAVTAHGAITVAGLLLFGQTPQRWLPETGVRFTRLLGSPTLSSGTPHTALEKTFTGALVPLLDQMWDTIASQMRTPAPDATPDYPTIALREALVNAVCHRDYRLRGAPIEIRMYDDQIVIASPGGLPGFMTSTSHLLSGRYSRNPRISWGLYQWGYIDTPGRGVLRMLTDMDQHGHRAPEIEAGAYQVSVRLYSARPAPIADPPAPPAPHLNTRQQAAIEYVRTHGSLTLPQFRVLCPDAPPQELQRDLSALVEAEHLRKIGPRTGAYYIMP